MIMADITVDFNQKIGEMKRLHGVNNGPVCYGSIVDVTDYYKNVEIPLVRLHDPNWPHPREVDIHTIFPNFENDPGDPANYDFSKTDEYIRSVIETGAKIVYRLGESIEHTEQKYYVHPPQDYDKWAQICIGIIRHYNHGWADGFHYNIEHWEIWNEPDNVPSMWSGTPEQYYELYGTVSTAIKRFDPSLKVGGFAATMTAIQHLDPSLGKEKNYTRGFLEYCRDHQLSLDFFSWHSYTNDPEAIKECSFWVKEELARYGFGHAEIHLNEWNYLEDGFKRIWAHGGEYNRRSTFEKAKGNVGASFTTAVLLMLQDCPVHYANYYDGQPTAIFCGLFDYYGVPQKTYDAFEAFRQLCSYSNRVTTEISSSNDGIYCCSTMNDDQEAAILISNYEGESRPYRIAVKGLEEDKKKLCQELRIDKEHDFRSSDALGNFELEKEFEIFIPQNSVVLLKIQG